MTWLLAVAGRSFGALVYFGAALLISRLLLPAVPRGLRPVLYDPGIQRRHPWTFAVCGWVAFYGMIGLVAYLAA